MQESRCKVACGEAVYLEGVVGGVARRRVGLGLVAGPDPMLGLIAGVQGNGDLPLAYGRDGTQRRSGVPSAKDRCRAAATNRARVVVAGPAASVLNGASRGLSRRWCFQRVLGDPAFDEQVRRREHEEHRHHGQQHQQHEHPGLGSHHYFPTRGGQTDLIG